MRLFHKAWVSVSSVLLLSTLAGADPPQLIRYQSSLTDDVGIPINATKTLSFEIFDAELDGTSLWMETLPPLVIQNGVVDILLGETTPIPLSVFAGAERYLEVSVEGIILTPRQRLTSVPYAHEAGTLGGKLPTEFLDTSATEQTKQGVLNLTDTKGGKLRLHANDYRLQFAMASGGTAVADASDSVSGDYRPFQVDGDPLQLNPNSRSLVGIGTATPSDSLHVVSDAANGSIGIDSEPGGGTLALRYREAGAERASVHWEFSGNLVLENLGTQAVVVRPAGDVVVADVTFYNGGNLSPLAAPNANWQYRNNMIKAWADLQMLAVPGVTQVDGFNVSTASYGPLAIRTNLTVNWHTPFGNANYVVMANFSSNNMFDAVLNDRTTTSCTIRKVNRTTGSSTAWSEGDRVQILVVGIQ